MYNEFEKWINNVLVKKLPADIIAINFNLYEDGNNCWSLEMVGTKNFDIDNEDWACDEVYDTRENPLTWEQNDSCERILKETSNTISVYLEKGKFADILKKYQGVGVGFVDGDINILYKKY